MCYMPVEDLCILPFLWWKTTRLEKNLLKSILQACTTVPQEQIMPSSLIYSTLETSSLSHMAPSPELVLVAWKQRWATYSKNVNLVGFMMAKIYFVLTLVVWLRSKQPFGHCRVGRLLSSLTARILKSQAMSLQTSWKGRKLAPSSLKWNLQVQGTVSWK